MSKYQQAADTLKREAQRYVALSEAAKALDEIGSLDQAANEAKTRAIANQKEADEIKDEIVKLKSSAEKIKSDHAAKQKEADDIYAKTIFDANMTVGDMLNKAEIKAEKIIVDAQAAAITAESALTGQISKLEAIKAALNEEVAALQQAAIEASSEAEAAEKRLNKVKESIAKLAIV